MFKKISTSIFIVFLLVSCSSTKKISSENLTQKYIPSISENSLKTNLTIIASDEMEG